MVRGVEKEKITSTIASIAMRRWPAEGTLFEDRAVLNAFR
jgi:hypothetical protein